MFISSLLISIFTVVELNCENLFDCTHDSLKNDYEFLPTSQRKWNKSRFWNKLTNLSKEILSVGASDMQALVLPDMAVLCEVENDSAMIYLTKRSLLRKAGYDYVMTNSNDKRGIDVALLYSPVTFRLLNTISFGIDLDADESPTRDILYASGEVISGDTLHIYMVHLPSRIGGSKSASLRMRAAVTLCNSIDSLQTTRPMAKILVAGDFNDYEGNEILSYIEQRTGLTNVTCQAVGDHGAKASYKYSGEWKSIDHILLSKYLLESFKDSRIQDNDFLLETDKKFGGKKPKRTFIGYRYNSGYSDHLPIVVNLQFREQ